MSYTSNQYKYLLIKRLQRHFSMVLAYSRAHTQTFFWELFDDSVTVTGEVYNRFCDRMDEGLALCAKNGWYSCSDIPKDVVNEQGLLLADVFATIGITLEITVNSFDGNAKFTKQDGTVMTYNVDGDNNVCCINSVAGTEYRYAIASAPAYNMQGMDVPQEVGNQKIAGPGTYWSYNAGTKTVTISGDGAYAGATNDAQLGSGPYTTVIVGANVSRLLDRCIINGVTALVLLQPKDGSIIIDSGFNIRSNDQKLDVYTDCTAAIEAVKAVSRPENITMHSLSEWNG